MFALGGALLALGRVCAGANLAKSNSTDPRNVSEALSRDEPGWRASMDTEIQNHDSNGSWRWIRRDAVPRGRHLIKLVWVFKEKRDGRKKSRLCVQGCAQTAGIDYDQTFSAALYSSSLRMIASLSSRFGLRLRRFDFVAAYLQGSLEDGETVYCFAPSGYERYDTDGHPMVCQVVKPVYGMAQAGRRWQRSLFPWLLAQGFTQSEADSCIFYSHREVSTPSGKRDERLVVGVYVDDLCVAYSHDDKHSLFHQFTEALQQWNVEDEGELTDLLGIDFSNSGGVVSLQQSAYISRLFSTYLPEGRPPKIGTTNTPCDQSLAASVIDSLEISPDSVERDLLKEYQSLVGALLYCATNTRPDVSFAVAQLCRAMARPTPALLRHAYRVLCYLHDTRDLGLRFESSDRALFGMTDSDWATRHSTSGNVFVLNRAAVSWGSKKQKTVALSSCEAEIVAASEAGKDAVHLSRLSTELGLHDGSPIDLHMDNKSGIDVAYNPEHHGRMKHVDRRHFFVRELVEDHRIRVPFVSTVNNIADFFTKALPEKTFIAMRNRIMNVPRDDGIVSTGGRCKEVAGARAAAADPDSIMSTLGHA